MQYRPLGKTGLSLSVLGFGGAPLGGVYGVVEETEAIRTVHAALDAGVNYFDVAPFYGDTAAEAALGKYLQGIAREKFIVSTKVGRYGNGFDFSASRIRRGFHESLARLGLDYADILIIHDIEFGDIRQVIAESIPTVRDLISEGKARFIGFSGLPLAIFPRVLDAVPAGTIDLILSYAHYTIADTSLDTLLPYLQAKEVGIINASPLGMGLLTPNVTAPKWHPAPDELRDACRKASDWCASVGVDIADLALAFSVSRPEITSTLTGMAKMDELSRNLAAYDSVPAPHLLQGVRKILQSYRDLSWPSGFPVNDPEYGGSIREGSL